jgi:GNAT superfamily N-acetyltransferase
MTPFTISSASEEDVPSLLGMIRELAEYEHLADGLEVTMDSLRAALFGSCPVARALVARVDGSVAGYAVYYTTFSTFAGRPGVFLEDLYVRPPFRRRGIGHALLEAVAKVCAELGGRFEWIALRWNEDALRLYRSLSAKVMEEWALLRMNSHDTRKLAYAHD